MLWLMLGLLRHFPEFQLESRLTVPAFDTMREADLMRVRTGIGMLSRRARCSIR